MNILIFLLILSLHSSSTWGDINTGTSNAEGGRSTGYGTKTDQETDKDRASTVKKVEETSGKPPCGNHPSPKECAAKIQQQKAVKRIKNPTDQKPLSQQQIRKAKQRLRGLPDNDGPAMAKDKSPSSKSISKNDPPFRPTSKGGRMLDSYLRRIYDNTHHFSANGHSCNYSPGQRLREDFDNSASSCRQNFQQAMSACDASQNNSLQNAMAEVRASIAEAGSARGTSVQQACKKYTASAKRLNDALKNFAGRCDPIQAQCQQTCFGTGIKSEGASMVVANDPFCIDDYDSISGNISSRARAAGVNAARCAGFQSVVQQASNDAAELTNSRAMSQLCSRQVAKECLPNSKDPSCQQSGQQGEDQKLSKLDANGQDLRGPEIYDGFNQPEGFSGSGPRDESGFHGRRGVSSSQNQLSLAGAGEQAGNVSGVGKEAAAKGSEQQDEELLADGDEEGLEDEENLDDPENEEDESSTSGTAKMAGANGNHPSQAKRSKELLKYLPGGANDPSAGGLPDGITGINGRSLFEKVSSRYADHRPRLDSFSRQVNQMNEKELKARVRQKMSVKRQLESRRKKKK